MKPSNLALPTLLFVSSSSTSAFTPPVFVDPRAAVRSAGFFLPSTSHIYPTISSHSTSLSPLSAYLVQDFSSSPASPNNNENDRNSLQHDASKYVQKMSPEERRENLNVMTQIFKHDLADLQRRRDYAGWVEAKKDLKQREAADPWFELNNLLKEAVQMDETEEAERLKKIIVQVSVSYRLFSFNKKSL